MNKNDIIELTIESMSSEGSGIGKYDGMAIFVPKTAVGDIINCKIVKLKKNYAFGIVDIIVKHSEHRQDSDCIISDKCGGCVYRHIKYDFEAEIKETKVKETISRIGGYRDFPLESVCSAPDRNRYRNKAQIPLGLDKNGELIMGFYGKHSHRIIDTKTCLLQPKVFDKCMDVFRKWHKESQVSIYNENTHKGVLRHLYLRYGESTKEVMVCLVATTSNINGTEKLIDMLKEDIDTLKTVVINVNKKDTNVVLGEKCINLYGDGYINDVLCGRTFRISPLSFYQVNRTQAENLYNKAKEYASLKEDDILLDLYCGTGTIGLSISEDSNKLIGADIVPQAIDDAKINAELNNRENTEFLCGDSTDIAKLLESRNLKPNVIVVDPPRKGLDKELIPIISDMKPERIVYISCDVSTLARDLVIFREQGYELKKGQAYDLFPGSPHCETVCLLSHIN